MTNAYPDIRRWLKASKHIKIYLKPLRIIVRTLDKCGITTGFIETACYARVS